LTVETSGHSVRPGTSGQTAHVAAPPRPTAVALVGTTASGKSSLAMSVARRLGDVELVCVDSMTVYRGMDIGTAKATSADRAAVRHHLLDLVDPGEEFTVRDFQAAATLARADIARRGRRALLVGGTGLHVRAVVDDLDIPGRYPDVAAALERAADTAGGVQALHARLAELDPVAASRTTDTNRRRIVRALEVTLGSGRPFSSFGPGLTAYPPADVLFIGLPFVKEVVDPRIGQRFARWIDEGLVEEVRRLSERPGGLSRTARQALGYKELLAHVEAGAPLEGCVAGAVQRTRSFARRQWSWFRRDPRIRWVGADEDPEELLVRALDRVGTGDAGGGGAAALAARGLSDLDTGRDSRLHPGAVTSGRADVGVPVRDW
jgi:tRNA dimethylallyltransferase